MESRAVSTGHYFPTKIIKNSDVQGHLEVQGNIAHSLVNDKNEIKAKINAFSFCLISFS